MNLYTLYGLTIGSEIELPMLLPGTGATDVEIRLGDLGAVTSELRAIRWGYRHAPDEAQVMWEDIATYVARNGREIIVDPEPLADPRSVVLGVLGPACAALLHQRGFLLLHASAVELDGVAVGFLGSSGRGKSTMAAALHAQGHPLVVDDVVAIRFHSGQPEVYPGFPQFKLWPDALDALGADPTVLPTIDPEMDKRARRITDGFCTADSLPLGRLYVLSTGERLTVELLNPRDAFLQLAIHSYGIRWLHEVSGSAHFLNRAELARTVPVQRLRRPRDLKLLPEIVRLVENDAVALV